MAINMGIFEKFPESLSYFAFFGVRKFGFIGLIRNSEFVIRNERNILLLAKCNHMVRQERSAHYSKIPIDRQRILRVRFVPNTIKFAFASAKAFLNYELRITNYEFGLRPMNPTLNHNQAVHLFYPHDPRQRRTEQPVKIPRHTSEG